MEEKSKVKEIEVLKNFKKQSSKIRIFKMFFFCTILLGVLYFILGINNELELSFYSFKSEKIQNNLRFLVISDLHSSKFGENNEEILELIATCNTQVDAVFLVGDIIDDDPNLDHESTYKFITEISMKFPSFYVSGNHELYTNDLESIKAKFLQCGVTILNGDKLSVNIRGNEIDVYGIDDPYYPEFENQLLSLPAVDENKLSILLAHRPERFEKYVEHNFDLVFSGHAHGGHFRIPFLEIGIFAPHQGLFPKYDAGTYSKNATTMILSRGLSKTSTIIPRLYNRPELLIVDVEIA